MPAVSRTHSNRRANRGWRSWRAAPNLQRHAELVFGTQGAREAKVGSGQVLGSLEAGVWDVGSPVAGAHKIASILLETRLGIRGLPPCRLTALSCAQPRPRTDPRRWRRAWRPSTAGRRRCWPTRATWRPGTLPTLRGDAGRPVSSHAPPHTRSPDRGGPYPRRGERSSG